VNTTARPPYPFENERYIGTVTQVGPSSVRANLPLAGRSGNKLHHGHRVAGGEVGEFVLIACDELALFGRVLEVRLPERERLSVEPDLGDQPELHPVGAIQLLATVDISSHSIQPGLSRYPRLGSRIYSAHPDFVRWLASARYQENRHDEVVIDLASLPDAADIGISLSPQQLFGRHCAVLGATGGGKSWTVARLAEQAMRYRSKVILLDATGEFYTLNSPRVKHCSVGQGQLRPSTATPVEFPYTLLTEIDLFGIFSPSGQSQGPKLREAIKSLKLARIKPTLAIAGIIVKAQQSKQPILDAYEEHVAVIESSAVDFDICMLSKQIGAECVWPNGGTAASPDHTRWGGPSNETTYCVSLQMRIENIVQSSSLACVFAPTGHQTIPSAIDSFLDDDSCSILRVSLQHVPFAHNAREIVANAIGRCLLEKARQERFKECPVIVIVDEAHQFLNKSIGDEAFRVHLDAFGLIAKEGRKHGLNICIATQRPRDIPDDVLSQMGTLIVHRLINDVDRRVVERASGEIDRSAAAFLPTLGPGEAIVIGVDIPVPLSIRIHQPSHKPDSTGPRYEVYWTQPMTLNVAAEQLINGESVRLDEISEGEYLLPDGTPQVGVSGVFRYGETALRLGEGSIIALKRGMWKVVSVDSVGQACVMRRVG